MHALLQGGSSADRRRYFHSSAFADSCKIGAHEASPCRHPLLRCDAGDAGDSSPAPSASASRACAMTPSPWQHSLSVR
eukprot:scaffold7017_cov113-Isochrysis_galbana.AAC.1